MYLRSATIKNTGPIKDFEFSFPFDDDRPKPVLMVGKNGSGKSTVISFIVNALIAMKQQVFDDAEVEKGRVYRIRSPLSIHGNEEISFAKLNFDQNINISEWQLNRTKSNLEDQGQFDNIDQSWNAIPPHETSAFIPNFGELQDTQKMEEMLNKNCLLFFPADRFEPPDWLNISDLSKDLQLPEPERMKGKTSRRIFSRNRLKPTLDWLNSVIFDMMVAEYRDYNLQVPAFNSQTGQYTNDHQIISARIKSPGKAHKVFDAVTNVMKRVLCEKESDILHLGIGDRKSRIVNATIIRDGVPIRIIKNLMSLSAGESALFCLFSSIIRDADLSDMHFDATDDINGIVIIDEVDMHLHVSLQYNALPELIALFPRIQFIISAHAPIIAIGLKNKISEDGFKIIELPTGFSITPESYSEFFDAFQAFQDTTTFRKTISEKIKATKKPILLLEGKSDAQLILTAWSKLYLGVEIPFEVVPCGVEPEADKRSGGSSMLRQSLEFLSTIIDRPVCGVFDFDRAGYEAFSGLKKSAFSVTSDNFYKKHTTKDIHGLLLPIPEDRIDFANTRKPLNSYLAIEHYFSNKILKDHGFSLEPIIAGATAFEIEESGKFKTSFSQKAANFDASDFGNFTKLFDRLKEIGFIN